LPDTRKHELWVDVAKALALVLVVIGHPVGDTVYAKYIYWFHMPAFFLLSGYLFRPLDSWAAFRVWLVKRCRELLVPYGAYLTVITLVRYYFVYRYLHIIEASFLWKDLKEVLFGGRMIGGYYTVFWFFTCLFATQVLFALIVLMFRNGRAVLAVVAIAYLVAHLEAWWITAHAILVPWNLDVALIAVAYYAIGYYGKKTLGNITPAVTMAAVMVSALLIAGDHWRLINYGFNLKYVIYQHPLLDLAIPVVMTTALVGISQLLARNRLGRAVTALGNVALPVVYLHVPVNSVLLYEYHFHYGNAAAVVIGLIVPLVISRLILDRFFLTRLLFQGRVLRPAQQSISLRDELPTLKA